MSKIRPLGDRVLIKRRAADKVSPGGIIIPGNATEKPIEGEILAIGTRVNGPDPVRLDPQGAVVRRRDGAGDADQERTGLALEAGQVVLFGKYAGNEVDLDGEKYLLIKAEDILGVIER